MGDRDPDEAPALPNIPPGAVGLAEITALLQGLPSLLATYNAANEYIRLTAPTVPIQPPVLSAPDVVPVPVPVPSSPAEMLGELSSTPRSATEILMAGNKGHNKEFEAMSSAEKNKAIALNKKGIPNKFAPKARNNASEELTS
jgi:hypothetical protein